MGAALRDLRRCACVVQPFPFPSTRCRMVGLLDDGLQVTGRFCYVVVTV